MKKYFFIPIATLALLSSCSEDIKVNLPGSDKKIVIEGSIENGKYPEVIITKSIGLFSSVNAGNINDLYVLDAQVYVTSGSVTDTLRLAVDSASSLGLVYKGHTLIGSPGQMYLLRVIESGKSYSSITTLPAPIALDSVWWKAEPGKDSLGFANAHLTDPLGFGNNYRWYAKRPTKDRRFIAPSGATFDDKYIDGKSFDFAEPKGYDPTDSHHRLQDDPEKERYYYKKTDTIYIKFCTIDTKSKNFFTTFENAVSSNGNPFASPTTILTNIQGGALGVWCGYGVTYDTIMPTP